jgi:hypothetical protein
MLYFVERKDAPKLEDIVRRYALEEDGDEPGAQANRMKLVHIDTAKGSAAGYIIKYVSKNIDGNGVGDHKAFENGETYTIQTDLLGNQEITASQRVTYWSQVWGIRQFQQYGGAPVGVWRELRRIKAETIEGATDEIRQAWTAAQAVKSENPDEARQADYAAYTTAMGGIRAGKNTTIKIAGEDRRIDGRYATYTAMQPIGVFAVVHRDVIYKSVRYSWTRIDGKKSPLPLGLCRTRTGLNNCTSLDAEISAKMDRSTKKLIESVKNKIFPAPVVDWVGICKETREIERETKNFAELTNFTTDHAKESEEKMRLYRAASGS